MHDIEPHYQWLHLYNSVEDEQSPFFEQEHSEFEFTQTIYNYLIHPQWDGFGSPTLYLKVLFIDYEAGVGIIELIGEWNDLIHNDVMVMKWFGELEDGWIAFVNFRAHVLDEIKQYKIDYYLNFGGELDELQWRKLSPQQLYEKVNHIIERRLA